MSVIDEKKLKSIQKEQRYTKKEFIGSGAFKSVYKAYDDQEGMEVAWNEVRLDGVSEQTKAKILGEITLLEQLRHQNIMEIFDSWETDDRVVFITEIMYSGTLKDFIRKVKKVRLKTIKKWARQILVGLDYLHSRSPPIIHRDIKCDNIFMNGNKKNGEIKIGDLGLSICMKDKKFAVSVIGTPEFMAPELYDEYYNEKIDIYAFGMCLLEMVTGEYPYSECENAAQVYRRVTQGIKPEGIQKIKNKSVREFIYLCLKDKDERPSAAELLQHPFLKIDEEKDDEIFYYGEAKPEVEEEVLPSSVKYIPPSQRYPNERVKTTNATTPMNEMEKSIKPLISKQSEEEDEVSFDDTEVTEGDEQDDDEKSIAKVVVVDKPKDENQTIEMKLYLKINGVYKEIKFPFSLKDDTAIEVAREMAAELAQNELTEQDCVRIANAIDEALIEEKLKPKQSITELKEPIVPTTTENPTIPKSISQPTLQSPMDTLNSENLLDISSTPISNSLPNSLPNSPSTPTAKAESLSPHKQENDTFQQNPRPSLIHASNKEKEELRRKWIQLEERQRRELEQLQKRHQEERDEFLRKYSLNLENMHVISPTGGSSMRNDQFVSSGTQTQIGTQIPTQNRKLQKVLSSSSMEMNQPQKRTLSQIANQQKQITDQHQRSNSETPVPKTDISTRVSKPSEMKDKSDVLNELVYKNLTDFSKSKITSQNGNQQQNVISNGLQNSLKL